MYTLRTLSFAAALALLAAPTLAQEKEMPQTEREPTQAEKAATFDNWLEQATPRIAWRNGTINAIVERMVPQLEQLPEGGTTVADLALGLHRMSDGQLQAANAHQQLLDLEAAINQGADAPSAELPDGVGKAALGDEVNLVFVPLTPCRIADSRKSSEGKLTRNVRRGYMNYNAAGQGGFSGCNFNQGGMRPSGKGAVALTVTATQAEGVGHLSLSPWNSNAVTSVLNFHPGVTIANSTVVKTTGIANQPDFEIKPNQNVHVIVDLLGFYMPNEPAALDCYVTDSSSHVTLNAHSTGFVVAPECKPEYTRVQTLCGTSTADDAHTVLREVGTHTCYYRNYANSDSYAYARSRCCRVPGNADAREW